MSLATIRGARQRETRAELDQLAATGEPEAVAGVEQERAKGDWSRGERGLSGARLVDTAGVVIEGIVVPSAARGALAGDPPPPQIDPPNPRATTLTDVRSVVIARLLKAAWRWLRPRERRSQPTGFRMVFTLPEMPSPAEMTIFETPFRIPRYMDHPEWRPR